MYKTSLIFTHDIRDSPLMALVFDILPLVAPLSPYVTCYLASMETMGIFSPRLNDYTSNRSRIKSVRFIYVRLKVFASEFA